MFDCNYKYTILHINIFFFLVRGWQELKKFKLTDFIVEKWQIIFIIWTGKELSTSQKYRKLQALIWNLDYNEHILRVGALFPVPPDPGAGVPPEGMVGVTNWLPPLGFLM